MASQLFTPAAQRVLAAAAAWTSGDDFDALEPPELLLGLLAETECRGAALLAAKGIDREAVLQRWPGLRAVSANGQRSGQLSPSMLSVIAAAEDRLWEYPRPLELATEHLLLGLLAAAHEAGQWLVERGFSADALEAEIHRWYGHRPGPLAVEVLDTRDIARDEDAAPEIASLGMGREVTWETREPLLDPFPGVEGSEACVFPEEGAADKVVPMLRVIDAAANRAREGLRVVEDYARMVLDDRHLTGELKRLRHALAATLARIPAADRLASRETLRDVGARMTTPAELVRPDMASIVAANFSRLQESLRTLEEYAKTLDPDAARRLEQLRYRAYTLQRALDITRRASERLAAARLCVLVDGRPSVVEFRRLVESLVAAGVHMIQLRDKSLADRELVARARLLRELARGRRTLLIINDRPDLAALAAADGVHVGQDDLSVKDARTVVGPRALVGVSTHSLEQARQAVLDGADYLGVGPTFPSGTKSFEQFPGVELLRAVANEIRLPAFAIGGIDCGNAPQVLATGMTRMAVGGAILQSADPAIAAGELLRALREPTTQPNPPATPWRQSGGGRVSPQGPDEK
jgi:thiamine-phosphate pyrophosphorylase